MIIMQVTFVSKNPRCLSNKPRRYLINTACFISALETGEELLEKDSDKSLYRALPVIKIEVHEVNSDKQRLSDES